MKPFAILLCAAFGAPALFAQTLLFGNPEITPGLQGQGYVVQASKSQTATSSSVTYAVTAPANQLPVPLTVGRLNLQFVPPANASSGSAAITITFTGGMAVTGAGNALLFQGGVLNFTPSPQTATIRLFPGTAVLTFYFNGQPTFPNQGTITVSFGAGGHQKPYLNDFDGVGRTDYAVWRPSQGIWYTILSGGVGGGTEVSTPWGLPGDVPAPGDYDGDGVSDYAIWRPSIGTWYVLMSSTGQQVVTPFGLPGDIPIVSADFDGDGKTDYAVWRPSTGAWYVLLSSTHQQVFVQFGLPGDIPLAGDFDGDGKTDYTVWRPSEGTWYILLSSNRQVVVTPWGLPGDIPIPGDYDGDGKTDYNVWRPSDQIWYTILSNNGVRQMTPWGLRGDIPVGGDYDGSGQTDYAIWRPSTGEWFVITPAGPQLPVQWGLPGDKPIGQVVTSVPTGAASDKPYAEAAVGP
ncbi:MAG: VCBS repeat-containing protein [Bryobacteraceae bacterium]